LFYDCTPVGLFRLTGLRLIGLTGTRQVYPYRPHGRDRAEANEPNHGDRMILDPKEQLGLRVRAAERAHDLMSEFGAKTNEAAIKAAEEAIKAVILINGGSAVAMLAFIGTIASRDLLSPTQISQITAPLLWFGGGVLCGAIASAMAYFTNLMIAGSANRQKREYEEPFLRDTDSSKRHRLLGEISRWIGIIAVAASLACFIGGLVSAKSAFSVLATTKPITAD